MIKYFLITKNKDLNINDFRFFLNTFLTVIDIIDYDVFSSIIYETSDDSNINEALSSYCFDSNLNFRIYIGECLKEEDYNSDINFLHDTFNNNLKEIIYDKKKFVLELITRKININPSFVLKEFVNDYSMCEILNAFFLNNLNVVQTSKAIYLHRNTLINKLDRFKEKTGYDPRIFLDAFVLYNILTN